MYDVSFHVIGMHLLVSYESKYMRMIYLFIYLFFFFFFHAYDLHENL